MKTRKATPDMRRVTFPIRDRAVLIPVELVGTFLPTLGAGLAGWLLGGWWLPFREFSLKGFVLGVLVMLPFAFWKIQTASGSGVHLALSLAALLLVFPAVTAFVSLNFTGSTPFISKSGVRLEMNRFIPLMAWLSGIGLVAAVVQRILELTGVA
jgi:hypothetical protein